MGEKVNLWLAIEFAPWFIVSLQEKEVHFMNHIEISKDVKIPVLGFGVFQIPQEQTAEAVKEAIKAGYRHIDTAQSYLNETEVGQGIEASGIDRSELFITTKVWIKNVNYEDTIKSIERSLQRLNLDYLDLVLIHQPYNDVYGSWRALEELKKMVKLKQSVYLTSALIEL